MINSKEFFFKLKENNTRWEKKKSDERMKGDRNKNM